MLPHGSDPVKKMAISGDNQSPEVASRHSTQHPSHSQHAHAFNTLP